MPDCSSRRWSIDRGYAVLDVAEPDGPPALLLRWEALSTPVQVAIVFPILAVVLFLLNVGPFNQPVWRSILYGLIEAVPLTALAVVATASERGRRAARTKDHPPR
jgi:hypothetical protein